MILVVIRFFLKATLKYIHYVYIYYVQYIYIFSFFSFFSLGYFWVFLGTFGHFSSDQIFKESNNHKIKVYLLCIICKDICTAHLYLFFFSSFVFYQLGIFGYFWVFVGIIFLKRKDDIFERNQKTILNGKGSMKKHW